LRRLVAIVVMLLGTGGAVTAASLSASSAATWDVYVRATETRIRGEVRSTRGFLALDFLPSAESARRAVIAGDVVVEPMNPSSIDGRPIEPAAARIEHWVGAILIRGTTASRLVDELQQGPPPSEDVLRSAVLERGPDWMLVSMRLQRKAIVTAVYDTVHIVTFTRDGATRATSTSNASRIVEISGANTPQERELRPGEDRGFLWRLNAYWRYQDVAGGVIAECESISLSRDIPFVLRFVAAPIVERTARDSMTRTLVALRTNFTR